jgi:hypothetical protein
LGAAVVLVLAVGMVRAEDAGKVGFDFRTGEATSIGVTWHITERFTLRPLLTYDSRDFAFSVGPGSVIEETQEVYGVDLGFLFTVKSHENLRLYTGASLQYSHTKAAFPFVGDDDINTKGAEVLFGLRYHLAKYLALFGEVGARYSTDDGPTEPDTYGLLTHGLGLIIYVK